MGNRLLRRTRKDAAEKEMIRIQRRIEALQTANLRENQLRVPLEEPKFWGYRRSLILRKDVARRSDADRLLELLKLVQRVQECRRKDFKFWDRDTRRWVDWNHTPKPLPEREFLRLPERLRCYFEPGLDKYRRRIYIISEPWMFESRRHKLWITHRFVPDSEIKQELAFWEDLWDRECMYWRFAKIKSARRRAWKKYYRCDSTRRQIVRRIVRMEIAEAIEIHARGELDLERGKGGDGACPSASLTN